MKNSLISMSVAALMASTSMVSFASPLTIPNTFVTGTPAVAAEVNGNFTAVENSVDDNDSRIITNAGAITAETNRATAAEGVNAAAIAAETNRATAAEGVNASDIADLQNGVLTCPTDMTAVGTLCVDIYEASVWTAATGGTQLPTGAPISACNIDGSDCGNGAANPIYARSVGVLPNEAISWYQAAQACANVGKRLPTTAEWQAAAAGTPPNTADASTPCNATGGVLAITGASPACVSTSGAFDMVGNLMEWSADLDAGTPAGNGFTDTNSSTVWALGESSANVSLVTADTTSMFVPGSGPAAQNGEIGFRCVR